MANKLRKALMRGGTTDEATLQGIEKDMGRKEALATLDMMSGDRTLAPMGRAAMDEIRKGVSELGGHYRTIKREEDVMKRWGVEEKRRQTMAGHTMSMDKARLGLQQSRLALARSNAEYQRRRDAIKDAIAAKRYAEESEWLEASRALKLEKLAAEVEALGATPGKGFNSSTRVKLLEVGQQMKAMDHLTSQFNEVQPWNETGVPFAGSVRNFVVKEGNPLGVVSKEGQQKAQWWRDFKRMFEIAQRHEMFGATLTGNEKIDWQTATINENMPREILEEGLTVLSNFMEGRHSSLYGSMKSEGYNMEAVDFLMGTPRGMGGSVTVEVEPEADDDGIIDISTLRNRRK